jgi:hypothetical protein
MHNFKLRYAPPSRQRGIALPLILGAVALIGALTAAINVGDSGPSVTDRAKAKLAITYLMRQSQVLADKQAGYDAGLFEAAELGRAAARATRKIPVDFKRQRLMPGAAWAQTESTVCGEYRCRYVTLTHLHPAFCGQLNTALGHTTAPALEGDFVEGCVTSDEGQHTYYRLTGTG